MVEILYIFSISVIPKNLRIAQKYYLKQEQLKSTLAI